MDANGIIGRILQKYLVRPGHECFARTTPKNCTSTYSFWSRKTHKTDKVSFHRKILSSQDLICIGTMQVIIFNSIWTFFTLKCDFSFTSGLLRSGDCELYSHTLLFHLTVLCFNTFSYFALCRFWMKYNDNTLFDFDSICDTFTNNFSSLYNNSVYINSKFFPK